MSLVEQGRPRGARVDYKSAVEWAASATNRSARSYEDLRNLVDARRISLGLRMLDVDVDAGLQEGYFAKLICGKRGFGPVSLGRVLRALNAELHLVPRSD
jgi:hypothetical protein